MRQTRQPQRCGGGGGRRACCCGGATPVRRQSSWSRGLILGEQQPLPRAPERLARWRRGAAWRSSIGNKKRKGKEGNGSKKSAALLPFDRNSRAKRFDANLCFLPRTFSLVALPFVPFSLSLPVAFSFSDPFQTTMFALKSSAASRAAVVAPRRQVRTGRAGVESKSRSVFFFLRWLSLRRLFALCSLFFFPGPVLTFS